MRKEKLGFKKHDLKCVPNLFQKIWTGTKTFDIRFNDRDYQTGDIIVLNELKPGFEDFHLTDDPENCYTGRQIVAHIPYLMVGPRYGLMADWVILSLNVLYQESIQLRTST